MTNLQVFEAEVPKSNVKHVIELFSTEYMFDHNAFKNAKKDEKFVKLKKIQRIKRKGFPPPLIFDGWPQHPHYLGPLSGSSFVKIVYLFYNGT